MNIVETVQKGDSSIGMIHPDFESLVQRIIQTVDKERLTELRRDFHTRLRITLTQPDKADLIEDLWDFFYDWCVFEQQLPEGLEVLSDLEKQIWHQVKNTNQRGLYTVAKASDDTLKLKELYSGKAYVVKRKGNTDFIGISRGDIIEARLVEDEVAGEKNFGFLRRPSYHPVEVHAYIKSKVRQFKKAKDFSTYQSWLWLLVGMYLKHRIYHHMPIDKIYDDNSRI
jgi:hypothetical protein